MADDNNKSKETLQEIEQKTKEAAKEVAKLDSRLRRISSAALTRIGKALGLVSDNSGRVVDELEILNTKLIKTNQLERALGISFQTGNKALLATTVSFAKFSAQASRAHQEMESLGNNIETATEGLKKTVKQIRENEKHLKSLGQRTEETAKEYDRLTQAIGKNKDDLAAHRSNLITSTEAYQRYQAQVVESKNNAIAEARAIAVQAAEYEALQLGLKGLQGNLKKIAAEKKFDWIQKIVSGGTSMALFAIATAKFNNAIAETADYLKATRSVGLGLGKDVASGWDGFGKAFEEASNTGAALAKTAADLGIKLDELSEAANKVRIAIRVDREGELSAKAITNLTVEAAKFSKISGVDIGTSVEMLDKRMKRFGMSAQEATTDLSNMRIVLGQMSAGNKANTVSIGEMVEILEEASAASQSYVVDTRIMTQALRGAVNQAQLLGASQKESKDIAKATAKVFGSAPDWVKVPAAQNLLSQLLGDDSDKFIGKFNKATRERLQGLRNAVRAGEAGQASAAREIFALIGNTEAGMDAQFDQLKKLLFDVDASTGRILRRNNEAALVVMKQFGVENEAVAGMMTRMMQDAAETQQDMFDEASKSMSPKAAKEFAQKMVPLSAGIAKQTATFNQSIKEALADGKDAIDVLVKQGMTKEGAKEYFDFYQKNAQKSEEYERSRQAIIDDNFKSEADKQNELALLRKKHFTEYTSFQMKLVKRDTDPVANLLERLKVDGEEVKINVLDFKKVGIENAEQLAKTLGVTNDEQKKNLEKSWKEGKLSGEVMRDAVIKSSAEAEKQQKNLTDVMNKFSEGFLTGTKAMLTSYLADKELFGIKLGGPMANVATALLALVGALGSFWLGGKLIRKYIQESVKDGVVEGMGMVSTMPGGSPDDQGGGGDGHGGENKKKTNEEKNKKDKPQKFARTRAVLSKGKGLAKTGLSRVKTGMGTFGKGIFTPKNLSMVGSFGKKALGKALGTPMALYDVYSDMKAIDANTNLTPDQRKAAKNKLMLTKGSSVVGGAIGAMVPLPGTSIVGSFAGEYLGGKLADATITPDSALKSANPMATPVVTPPAGTITGADSAMAVPSGPPGPPLAMTSGVPNVGATQIAQAMRSGGPQALRELIARPQIGGVNTDGSVTLKIENFIGLLSDVKQTAARSNQPSLAAT